MKKKKENKKMRKEAEKYAEEDKKKKEEVEIINEADSDEKKGITESFLGGIPILGDLVKELGKTETFKKRFEEVDEKIKENLEKGEKKKWGFEANISVRPIIKELREEASEITMKDDYICGKKGNKIILAVKAPEDVDLEIKGKNLFIKGDNFEKKIELPDYFRNTKKKQYKKGILILELTK